MEIDVYQLLMDNPLLLTFVVIGSGYVIGKLQIGGVTVGSTAGVLVAGLVLGHFGMPDSPEAANFGFAVFIFSVGVQAGPSFFGALKEDGARYAVLAGVVGGTAALLTVALSELLELEPGLDAGLLAGSLTSTPTLAGARDAVASGMAALPSGMTPARASTNISVAYALTYVFGTVGMITTIRFLPRVLGIDLPAEARRLAQERGIGATRRRPGKADSLPVVRAYRVAPEAAGQTVEARRGATLPDIFPLRIRRGHQLIDPEPETVLAQGDIVSIIGSLSDHEELRSRLGEEVLDAQLLDFGLLTEEIVITQPEAESRKLGELELRRGYGCFAVGLARASIELAVDSDTMLQRGDRLRVTGEESQLHELATRLGFIESEQEETDLMTLSFGMIVGILLGLFVLNLGGISIGLGSAGGLLTAGIVIGFLSSINPTFGRVPAAANKVVMDLGLVLFMAGVGLSAGGGVAEALASVGAALIGAGVIVTLAPVVVGYLVGRKLLKLNPALMLGSIAGAMTNTPSLKILSEVARSPVPALGYAGTYTFANVLLTFVGATLMRF